MASTRPDGTPDVETSLLRIIEAVRREAEHLAHEYPIIAAHLHSEADRLHRLTG